MENIMTKVKVSVIIPVYNTEKYLDECLNSVINQSLLDIEIICIDDCSTDRSLDILEKYRKRDKRILLKRNKSNQGLSICRNIGMKSASGEYIFFLDSDDYIINTALELLYEKTKIQNLDILFYNGIEFYDNGKKSINNIRGSSDIDRIYPNVVAGVNYFVNEKRHIVMSCLAIYKNEFLKTEKLMFYPKMINEDNLFYLQSLIHADRVSRINNKLYFYRRRNDSLSIVNGEYQQRFWSELVRIREYRKYYGKTDKKGWMKSLFKYIKSDVNDIRDLYEKIEAFDMKHVEENMLDYMEMSSIISDKYKGYFIFKLPSDILYKLSKADCITIYGAGKVGQGLYSLLKERHIGVNCFAETNITCERVIDNIKVKNIDDIDRKSVIVIAISKDKAGELKTYALESGFDNIVDVSIFAEDVNLNMECNI